MTRSSKVIGTVLSVLLLGVALCPLPGTSTGIPLGVVHLKELIARALQAAAPVVGKAPTESAAAGSQAPPVSVGWDIASSGDFAAGQTDPGPSVNFEWRNADHVLTTAEGLGLRVIAVGPAGVLGEVGRKGPSVTLLPLGGELSNYSKVTRSLPSDFFGTEIAHTAARPVSEYLIFFPPQMEQAVIELVHLAIEHEGKSMRSISGVRGELSAVSAQPSFKITHVFERS